MLRKDFFGKEVMPFTIPSGIITTTTDVIRLFSQEIPQLGILTTKSIGTTPREGNREPVLSQVDERSLINAVGLANPGVNEFKEELKEIYPLHNNKFLLTSLFGGTAEEFVAIIKKLEDYTDGFELNFSCPHATGYGAAIGSDKSIVYNFTEKIRKATKKPIIVKLTPNVDNIAEIAKAAVDAGADSICAINTVGPFDSKTLSNTKGGLSGKQIKEKGIECVKEISKAVNVPIIAMGGIFSARDVKAYEKAGARFFGIGTALTGLDTQQIKEYFRSLVEDLKNNTNSAEKLTLNRWVMKYLPYKLKSFTSCGGEVGVFIFDKEFEAEPGQFIFVWLPGKGEKPFGVLEKNPLTIVVKRVGPFTSELFKLKKGDEVMIRGPYGKPLPQPFLDKIYITVGGTGIAPLYLFIKNLKKKGITPTVLMGAKENDCLLLKKELSKVCDLRTIIDDEGFVTDLLKEVLEKEKPKNPTFYNCGPEIMMKGAVEIELGYSENIFCMLETYMKCGVGTCGSCSIETGKRVCVDGPMFGLTEILKLKYFGEKKRGPTGGYVKI